MAFRTCRNGRRTDKVTCYLFNCNFCLSRYFFKGKGLPYMVVELVPNLRKSILSKQPLVDKILELASQGTLIVHKEVSTSEVEVEKLIASGSLHLIDSIINFLGASAKVYKAKYKGKAVALKRFDTENFGFSIEEFRREVALLNILVHDNILPVSPSPMFSEVEVFWSNYKGTEWIGVHSLRTDDQRNTCRNTQRIERIF